MCDGFGDQVALEMMGKHSAFSKRPRECIEPTVLFYPILFYSNDQTFFLEVRVNVFFLLDDRLAKFTSPTICINMSIGSRTTL